jgi:dipeptidyl aminopeptidase/acylaminoacyl peptidase
MTQIANGTLLDACFPSGDLERIDAVQNIHSSFPPTCIVHGDADVMVPLELSRMLSAKLKESGVCYEMIEVPDESHTFAGKMIKGSRTWEIQRRGFDWVEKQLKK